MSGESRRLESVLCLVTVITVVSFLIPLYFTRRFFYGPRLYAHTPVLPWMPELPLWVDMSCYFIMCGLLVLTLLVRNPRPMLCVFLALSLVFSLWDQSRWMPYYVQYWLMLGLLATYNWRDGSAPRAERVLNGLRVIPISIWFWSGIHKVSARYLFVGFPWLVSPFTENLDPELKKWVLTAAFLSPIVEAGSSLLILCRPTRKLGVISIIGMHLVILVIFGPFGLAWNQSVWSWNVAMIAFAVLLYWRSDSTAGEILFGGVRKRAKVGPKNDDGVSEGAAVPQRSIGGADRFSPLHLVITIFFGVLPALNYAGMWDDFLSHALYSWTTTEAEIHLEGNVESSLPAEVRPHVTEVNGRRFVHILNWSYALFASPPYHAERVFKQIFRKLCTEMSDDERLELWIFGKPDLRTSRSEISRYRCKS